MNSREPAGEEWERGKFAELFFRARKRGGAGEKIFGTVRSDELRGRYLLTGNSALLA
jgi:hypothetical protein